MIPNPAILICWFRCLFRSIRLGKMVSGHDFQEVESEGQPRHVQVLICNTCGEDSMAWTKCDHCGKRPD